jgi:uncharacterized damage-inducible protein DinB
MLQPAAHAFVMALEDVEAAVSLLTAEQLWLRPGGAASVGFHVAHLARSTDRLLTYARDESLSEAQRTALHSERSIEQDRPANEDLLAELRGCVSATLEQLSSTAESTLLEPRFVGRARLPSNVLGLLFHAAEHASRHTGQIVTTVKLVRGTE